jgi:Bacterial HORMA domain family 1
MTGTFTASQTSTYTDARLRAVMPEVGADFYALAGAGIVSLDVARRWTEELTFVLHQEAARGFQIQLGCPNGHRIALDYRVSSDGSIRESGTGGGVDYYALPSGTRAFLFVDLNYKAAKIAVVQTYIRQRGWTLDAQAVQGEVVRDRAYSKDGYGVIRGKIGAWPS